MRSLHRAACGHCDVARAQPWRALCTSHVMRNLPPPPPLPTQRAVKPRTRHAKQLRSRSGQLPPPPPLPGLGGQAPLPSHSGEANASSSSSPSPTFLWDSTQEVLSSLIEYVPTFYVPINSVAAILEDEALRASVTGRGRFVQLLRRFPFLFDVRLPDAGGTVFRAEVRLCAEVNHPRRGAADDKYMLTDVGESTYRVAKPEHVVWNESVDQPAHANVRLSPARAPPAVRVRMEERPAVLERLVSLIPTTFTAIDRLEETVPEEILFDAYFDCQGGLAAILGKFPDDFQVVGETVRRRPDYLAPLALDEWTLSQSPLPSVAALVQREVCSRAIPQWISVTSLYEQLSSEARRELKQHGFKSLAGFLRAHGRSVAVSTDMVSVSMWVPPQTAPSEVRGEDRTNVPSTTVGAAGEPAPPPPPPPTPHTSASPKSAAKHTPPRTPRNPREALAALEAETEAAFLAANKDS